MPARPALAGHLDAVDVGDLDARKAVENGRDLLRRDVLALPAEGVADAVDEVEVVVGVAAQEIAGAEPGVAGLEDVAQDLAFGFLRRRVALEALHAGVLGAADAADELADLAGRALDAEALGVAHVRLGLDVEANQPPVVQLS